MKRRGLFAGLLLALAAGCASAGPAGPGASAASAASAGSAGLADGADRVWDFQVLLDGKPIGEHRFSLSRQPGGGGERRLLSQAKFKVRFLGITVYHYQLEDTEEWQGNCLLSLSSVTDDDGDHMSVTATRQGDRFVVVSPKPESVDGCLMSYAYWYPQALQTQTRLIDPQTGHIGAVQVTRIDSRKVEVRGRSVEAQGLEIRGPGSPIDSWYTADGEWIGLDSTVRGGRKLSYRLH